LSCKTIWIVCQYAGSKYHGMGFRQYYLGREYVKNGYETYIMSGSFSHQFIKLPQVNRLCTHETIDGINYIWVKIPRYKKSKSLGRALSMIIFLHRLLRMGHKSLRKPDVILVSSPSPLPILIASRWAKKYNAELIFEVRDIWPLTLIELGSFSRYNPLIMCMQFCEKHAYKKADFVVSVLPKAKEHMMSKGMREDKFHYIPNGISLDETEETEPLDKEILHKIPKQKFIVGYTGTLGIANALEYFIEAARILKDCRDILFVLVGDGGEKERLVNIALSLDNVLFLDAVTKSQIPNILKQFDVCFISLKKESLFRFGISPNKLFDYMLAGKPVLFAVESGNDPVREANCGISVEAENARAIVDAVLKFFSMSKKERDILGNNGKRYMIKSHTYEILSKKYIELFEKA